MAKIKFAKAFVFSFLSSLFLICLLAYSAFAVNGGPSDTNEFVEPGDTYEGVVYTTNTSNEPMVVMINQSDITKKEDGSFAYSETPLGRGLLEWTEFTTEKEVTLEPGEKFDFKYVVDVPADADPGTYSTGFLLSERPAGGEVTIEGSGAIVSGRVLSQLYITVAGDFNENLLLEGFGLNKNALMDGNVVFDIKLKNEGDVMAEATGNITIFDSKNNQLEGIYAITEKFEDQEVVTERQDSIPVKSSLLPNEKKTKQVAWTHRQVEQGKYKAKLELFYGQNQEKIEKTLDFEISENFAILELGAETLFSSALPVGFNVKIANTGNTNLELEGYFEVKNIFGSSKHRVDIKDLVVLGGQEIALPGLEWNSGFALGLYTANLHLDVGGQIFEKSTVFWVISWWQAIILALVLLLIVFGAYKGIKGYMNMKGKLEKMEHKDESVVKEETSE